MERFIIISPHTADDCTKAIKQVEAAGYLTHFEWGCKDGNHTGWVILEAENAKEAIMVVPTAQRPTAKAVRLIKFTPEDLQKMHS